MKRIMCFVVSVLILVSMTLPVSAAKVTASTEVIQYDDGSYLVITIQESPARGYGTRTGFAMYEYTASDGTLEWKAILAGTYSYDGTSATCTTSSCTVTVYASNWYEDSKTVGKSGDTATATVVMGRTFLGITIAKNTYEMTLTCDKDGNLY